MPPFPGKCALCLVSLRWFPTDPSEQWTDPVGSSPIVAAKHFLALPGLNKSMQIFDSSDAEGWTPHLNPSFSFWNLEERKKILFGLHLHPSFCLVKAAFCIILLDSIPIYPNHSQSTCCLTLHLTWIPHLILPPLSLCSAAGCGLLCTGHLQDLLQVVPKVRLFDELRWWFRSPEMEC